MPKRPNKKPTTAGTDRDTQQIARSILDAVAPDAEKATQSPQRTKKNPAAVALGRLEGLMGGKARAAILTPAKRKAIARRLPLSGGRRTSGAFYSASASALVRTAMA